MHALHSGCHRFENIIEIKVNSWCSVPCVQSRSHHLLLVFTFVAPLWWVCLDLFLCVQTACVETALKLKCFSHILTVGNMQRLKTNVLLSKWSVPETEWMSEWADCSCTKFLNAGRTCRATQCSSDCSKTSLFKVQEQLQQRKIKLFLFFCAADPLETLSVITWADQLSEDLLDTNEQMSLMMWWWCTGPGSGRGVEGRRRRSDGGWRSEGEMVEEGGAEALGEDRARHHVCGQVNCVCVCVSYTYRSHQLSPDFCLFTALLFLFFILSVSVFAAFVVSLLFLSDLLWHTRGQSFSRKNEGYEFSYCSISR